MRYALINDNIVIDTVETDSESEVAALASRFGLVVSCSGSVTAGWVVDGNKVVPPYDKKAISSANTASLKMSIIDKKKYADDLLERFKNKNIVEGINAVQGMWMHSRMRAVSFTFYGLPVIVDILNMAVSGDVELACLALMYTTPDDGSAAYHWLTQERINWIVADMKGFLGWA